VRLAYPDQVIGNFGDDLNLFVWHELAPEILDRDDRVLLVGIGTILNERLPDAPLKVVLGSGVGYGKVPRPDTRWRFEAVRGPLSARALNLPQDAAVTDAGVLVREMGWPEPGDAMGTVFMPHHASALRAEALGVDLDGLCREAGVGYLDPGAGVPRIVGAIRAAQRVVAEAMHGAIVADAFRVPWVGARLFAHRLESKWEDWEGSLGLRPTVSATDLLAATDPHTALRELLAATAHAAPTLSDEPILRSATDTLVTRLERVRRDVRTGALAAEADRVEARPDPSFESVLKERQGFTDSMRVRWGRVHGALRELTAMVGPDQTIVLIDLGAWGVGDRLEGRPVLRMDGWGPDETPSGDPGRLLDEAIARGATLAAVGWPAFGRLRRYPELERTLRERHATLHADDTMLVFDLRATGRPARSRLGRLLAVGRR
jgi:succinoglycan biosynthesis protein ExoV